MTPPEKTDATIETESESGSAPNSYRLKDHVVVGIDDHPTSSAALRFAVREGALRKCDVVAVHAWHYPTVWGVVDTPRDDTRGKQIGAALQKIVDNVGAERERDGEPAVKILINVVEGPAGVEIQRAARHAALLVMGARRHNRFLGSVSQAILNDSAQAGSCPVVVVSG